MRGHIELSLDSNGDGIRNHDDHTLVFEKIIDRGLKNEQDELVAIAISFSSFSSAGGFLKDIGGPPYLVGGPQPSSCG